MGAGEETAVGSNPKLMETLPQAEGKTRDKGAAKQVGLYTLETPCQYDGINY